MKNLKFSLIKDAYTARDIILSKILQRLNYMNVT